MAVPKYNEFFPYYLLALRDGEAHTTKEILDFCANAFELTEEDKSEMLASGVLKFNDRVAWARTYLKKAGLIESAGKGVTRLTAEGLKVARTEPLKVTLDYLMRYDSFLVFIGKKDPGEPVGPGPTMSPQERLENAVAELNKALADSLMEEVMKITPYDFERLVVKLLIAMGYGSAIENKNAVTRRSGDEGIDGVLTADKFGFDSIYIQAKQWQPGASVGRPEVQKFCGAMMGQGATKGLFITTADFTEEARGYARKNLSSKIVLVNGEDLANLMIEYDVGVSTVETYRVKRVDSDFFQSLA